MASLTHQGAVFSICATPQTPTLDQAAFEALTYVPVPGVVTGPSFRVTQNLLTQNTLDTDIAQKQGGFRQGEDTEITVAFNEATQAGVAALEAAASDSNIYAVKYEMNNSLGTNGTTFYALAIVGGGGGLSGGGGEDFANRIYTLGITDQLPVEVAAA